jgi:hypothetical protein
LKVPVAGLALAIVCCLLGPQANAEVSSFKILRLEGNNVAWHKPANGAIIVTYRIVGEPVDFQDARNCRKMTSPDELLAASGVSKAALHQEIEAAFAMWQAAADIYFREAPDRAHADILIGAQAEPEGYAFADVFYDSLSPDRIKPISRALVCLNPLKRWKIGFDGDLKTYDLRYTLAHEIGHAIGLDHPNGAGQIMGYRYEEHFRQLQPGDIAGAVTLYGSSESGVEVAADVGTEKGHVSVIRRFDKRWGTRAFIAPSP